MHEFYVLPSLSIAPTERTLAEGTSSQAVLTDVLGIPASRDRYARLLTLESDLGPPEPRGTFRLIEGLGAVIYFENGRLESNGHYSEKPLVKSLHLLEDAGFKFYVGTYLEELARNGWSLDGKKYIRQPVDQFNNYQREAGHVFQWGSGLGWQDAFRIEGFGPTTVDKITAGDLPLIEPLRIGDIDKLKQGWERIGLIPPDTKPQPNPIAPKIVTATPWNNMHVLRNAARGKVSVSA